eukprot:1895621-Pyramimonas_sp.AAC.2
MTGAKMTYPEDNPSSPILQTVGRMAKFTCVSTSQCAFPASGSTPCPCRYEPSMHEPYKFYEGSHLKFWTSNRWMVPPCSRSIVLAQGRCETLRHVERRTRLLP